MTTAIERLAAYQRIFENIPPSFLDAKAEDNQHFIGAIARACARTESAFRFFEDGLFLDSANLDDTTGGSDAAAGLSSLERWGVWLQLPRASGETADEYRLRLMARLFAPKVTINAIKGAVERITGLPVAIVEPVNQIVRFNEGPWAGKKLLGRRYGYMNFEVVTQGQTNILPSIVPLLKAAGTHWRHIEVVVHEILLSLGTEQSSTISRAWDSVSWLAQNYRPGLPLDPDAQPLTKQRSWSAGETLVLDTRAYRVRGADLISDMAILAAYTPEGGPLFNWDDSLTLWDEGVWAD